MSTHRYAADAKNFNVVTYLLRQDHHTETLLQDKKFIFNLMACGKGNGNQPIEDFIVHSPAPVDMAAKMSAIYNELSFKV